MINCPTDMMFFFSSSVYYFIMFSFFFLSCFASFFFSDLFIHEKRWRSIPLHTHTRFHFCPLQQQRQLLWYSLLDDLNWTSCRKLRKQRTKNVMIVDNTVSASVLPSEMRLKSLLQVQNGAQSIMVFYSVMNVAVFISVSVDTSLRSNHSNEATGQRVNWM